LICFSHKRVVHICMEKVLRMLVSHEKKITPACVHANILFLCMHCLLFNSFVCEIGFLASRDSPRDMHASLHPGTVLGINMHATFICFLCTQRFSFSSIPHASISFHHMHIWAAAACMRIHYLLIPE
jgi:hypothetical protein